MKTIERDALKQAGFHQGLPDEEKNQCEKCGKTISGTRLWWLGEARSEPTTWCRDCALFYAHVRGYLEVMK